MKKLLQILMLALFMVPSLVKANEGMWLVSLLNRMNEAEMKGLGLNLTAEEIYSINNASLKDAIVRLNGGMCTGEIVSDQGLIFTNHHCGFDAIQSLSTVENNLLANGFCAKSFNEELPIPNFKIQFLVRIDDVTKDVLSVVTDAMTEEERDKAIGAKIKEITGKNSDNGKYEIEVKSFFYGNEYYMMVYEAFNDIRLVGNPPESVGKFGGDTDNWMWPRHTGDFSILRVYASKDNKPAAYSADNVPYKPKHSLPVNIDGVEEGDFSMIMGFPGRTTRYLTSYGINQAVEIRNPALIECLGTKLESWKEIMDQDKAIDLMYAAKYASTANGWKYYIGQNRGLKRLDVKSKKAAIESEFSKWVNQKDERKSKYGSALDLIKDYHNEWDPSVKSATYSSLCGYGGAEFMGFAHEMGSMLEYALSPDEKGKSEEELKAEREKKKATLEEAKSYIEEHFKEYNSRVDKNVFINLTNLHRKNIPAAELPTWHAMVDKKTKGNVQVFADKLFATSIFVNKEMLMKFFEKPNLKAVQKDMAYAVAKSAYEHANAFNAKNPRSKMNKGYRLFTAGLREMNSTKQYAPDANSTMRLTYGTVGSYKPADGVSYSYYTTAAGIMEKRDNTNPEFIVPDKLATLIEKKDFGKYANKNGELVTCFIGNLDITGGNSGSPVIDGDGNLIGIAFDGNWEAMSGDIAFEPELQRTISVDIRYVLFTIEKLMGGQNLINELKFSKKKPKPVSTPVETSTGASTGTTVTPGATTPVAAPKTEVQKKAEEAKAKAEAKIKEQNELNRLKGEEVRKKREEELKKAQEQGKDAKKKGEEGAKKPAQTIAPSKK